MQLAVAFLSVLATVTLSLVTAFSAPQPSAVPAESVRTSAVIPAGTPSANPTVLPQTPLKCLQKNMVSYCIPNTAKYQVCTPTKKVIECPIGSYCKESADGKGNTIAYCKFIG